MKQVYPNYTFNAATKTITLVGAEFHQGQILLITNATRGAIYYNFASSSLRAAITPGSGNTTIVLTDASTAGHQNTDKLIIHYDDLQERIDVNEVGIVGGLRDGDGNTFGIDRNFPVEVQNNVGVSVVSAIQDGDGTTFGIDRNFPVEVQNEIVVSALRDGDGSIFGIDRTFPVELNNDVRLTQNPNSGLAEASSDYIKVSGFPVELNAFNGIYQRTNVTPPWSTSSGANLVSYTNISAFGFGGEFVPRLDYTVIAQAWPPDPTIPVGRKWFFSAEELVAEKAYPVSNWTIEENAASWLGSVSPIGLTGWTSGVYPGNFSNISITSHAPITTRDPALGSRWEGISGSDIPSQNFQQPTVLGLLQRICFRFTQIFGNPNTSASGSDTDANATIISLFKRLLQRITTLVPANLTVTSTRLLVDGSGVTQPVSAASLPLPSGAATSANQTTANTSIGATSEAAATTDTATSGLNGLLKRLLQRITTLIPANLTVTSNRLDVNPNFGGYFDAYDTQAQDKSFSVAAQIAGQGYTGFSANSHVTNLPASYPVTDNGGSLTVDGTVTANVPVLADTVFGVTGADVNAIRTVIYSSSGSGFNNDDGMPVDIDNPLPISGTVTAQGKDNVNDVVAPIPLNDGASAVVVEQSGTFFVSDAGENYQAGTISLTNNTAAEISYNNSGVNGFSTVVLEIVTSGVTWASSGLVAQAHNQSGAPTDQQIMCPLGVRITHSADTTAGLSQGSIGTVGYVNLEPNISTAGYHGTRLDRFEYDTTTQAAALPATGTRFFIFDLTTSKFFLKGNFTAGTVTVNYRLYRTRHPVFSARKTVVTGEAANGAVRVVGSVDASVSGSVYLDGGYLDDTGSIYNAISGALSDNGVGSSHTQPVSGTVTANAGTGSFTVAQATHANLKAQAQILDSSGNQINYIQAGTAGLPSSNVLSVQGVASGTAIPVSYSSGIFPVTASSLPLPSGASTSANQTTTNSNIGATSESAATTDTSTSGLNGLLKRLLQRITALIPANLTVTSTRLLVDGSGVTQPVTDRGATGEATVSEFTSTTSATLKSSNSNRKVLIIYNEGAGNLHVLYGAGTASTTNYSVRVDAGNYLEIGKYTGEVRAIFATSGTARVTEIL